MEHFLSFIPSLFILNSLFLFIFRKWLGPIGTFYSSIFTIFMTLICLLQILISFLKNGGYWFLDLGRWFFCLNWFDSHLVFCFDLLGVISAILVASLTSLALLFGVEYMYREAFVNRLLYLLNLFATSVFLLFFCYDLFLILLAWECIGLFSLLLVNFYSTRIYTLKAALKTFILSRLSDFFMFIFFLLTLLFFHTTDLSLIFIQIPFFAFHYFFIADAAIHLLTVYSLMLALSGVIKSAQFLAHVWLPDAMEAPTPASALIHSSTLVVAGVFLILRFATLFEFAPLTNYFLAILGASTLAFASVVAIFQNDIKKLVAFSTISQIGYLVCGCGFLCYEEVLIYLIVHAINKAFLFIGVGYLVHFFSGNTDLRQMGSSFLFSFDLTVLLLGVSVNLCGLPYSAGFFGKEFLIFQFFGNDWFAFVIRACWLVSFFCTPLYMGLLIISALYGSKKGVWVAYSTEAGKFFPYLAPGKGARYTIRNAFSFEQVSFLTSIWTSSLLFLFWVGLFWFGEQLLLIILNYMTIGETVSAYSFSSLRSQHSFEFSTGSERLRLNFEWELFFIIASSILFLVQLKFGSLYTYSGFFYLVESFVLGFFFVNFTSISVLFLLFVVIRMPR